MQVSNVETDVQLPVTVELEPMSPSTFVDYYNANRVQIESRLLQAGAVKFRGVQIDSLASFQQVVDAVSTKFMSYVDGNSPRTKLSGNVYTSTEYDASQRITMHNELSYSPRWPGKLFLSCLQPAETGGETLLADSRLILRRMPPEIVREIEQRGITYIRNLHGGTGMGPSWQDTFETSDKARLEAFCNACGVDYEWGPHDSVRVKQFSKGILEHPVTGEKTWFNQIDQFHPSHLGEEMHAAMQLLYDAPEDFPMYVRFGDGKEIPESLIRQVLDTIDEVTVAPAWQKNEFLVVDNQLACHGRNSYTGSRKVLVAMSE